MKYTVVYYESVQGESPMNEFLDSLKERNQVKVINQVRLLEEYGPQLPRPYADLLEDGIHELRVKLSGDQVRAMYFFTYRHYIVMTHVFIKNSSKVPKAEINQAKKYREDFLKRFKTEMELIKELEK